MNKLLLGVLLMAAVLFPGVAKADEELIVRLEDNVSIMFLTSLRADFVREVIGSENTYVVKGDLETIQRSNGVKYAERNIRLHALPVEEDEDLAPEAKAWGISKIEAPAAWAKGAKGKGVVVAVIDTGVDYTHPALKGKIWVNKGEIAGNGIDDDENGFIDDVHGYNFADKSGDPMDDNDHGTHCAGTIAGKSIGVAPSAKIMAIKFLDKNGGGSLADAVESINYARMMKADIMSNSWGGGGFTQSMFDAIEAAKAEGIIFVAAAGNSYADNDRRPAYPASYKIENVISVAATDINDVKANFSNWGKTSVHVAAPGKDVYSSIPGGKYASFSGTSMACPHVSGVAALMLSSGISKDAVKQKLIDSSDLVDALKEKSVSNGRVNASKAVD